MNDYKRQVKPNFYLCLGAGSHRTKSNKDRNKKSNKGQKVLQVCSKLDAPIEARNAVLNDPEFFSEVYTIFAL